MQKDMFAGGHKYTFKMTALLRKHITHTEQFLWHYLNTKPSGLKFRRQHVSGVWVLDFNCHALQLAIQVDGSIHDLDEVRHADARRQNEIENKGLTFSCFTNDQTENNFDAVRQTIENYNLINRQPDQKTLQPKSPLQGDRATTPTN